MPIYEYFCELCSHTFEVLVKNVEDIPTSCPKCGDHDVERVMSSSNFQCNTRGCYTHDYGGKRGK